MDYNERLAEAMGEAVVSEAALAKALGVSYQAVKKVLAGGTKALSAPNNSAAAAFLGVNPDWLATGHGPKRPISVRALQVADLLDQRGREDSPEFLIAWADLMRVLEIYAAGQRPAVTPRPPAAPTPVPSRAREKHGG